MSASSKEVKEAEDLCGLRSMFKILDAKNWIVVTNCYLSSIIHIWWKQILSFGLFLILDQPYSTDPGWQQEEDLHQETAFYVRLRTIGHRLPTHTAAARDYCGASHHRATSGLFFCFQFEGFVSCFYWCTRFHFLSGNLWLPKYQWGSPDLQSNHIGGGSTSGLQWPAYP